MGTVLAPSSAVLVVRASLTSFSEDIRSIFDSQLSRMFELIDRQMNKMGQLAPNSGIVGLEVLALLVGAKLTNAELYGALWGFEAPNMSGRNPLRDTSPIGKRHIRVLQTCKSSGRDTRE